MRSVWSDRTTWRRAILMIDSRLAGIVIVVVLTPFAQADSAGLSSKATGVLDNFLLDASRPDEPGCAIGVAANGKLIYARGFGLANMELNVPITPDTVFRVGSVSKQFTAASIALLSLRGKLDLDADIRSILPDLPEYEHTVTVTHLVHHSSGIPDVYRLLEILGYDEDGNFYESNLALDVIRRVSDLEFVPGTRWAYSNSGYLLLAEIVESVSGKSLRQFAHENVFEPLGMSDTHFHDDHRELIRNRADGYVKRGDGRWEIRNSNFTLIGDGGVFTTLADLAKWDLSFYDDSLHPGFPQQMRQAGGYREAGPRYGNRDAQYLFGLFREQRNGESIVWHSGGWAGFRARFVQQPAKRKAIFMLCNSGRHYAMTDTSELFKLLMQAGDISEADSE